jgi:hypothetical protein
LPIAIDEKNVNIGKLTSISKGCPKIIWILNENWPNVNHWIYKKKKKLQH